MFSLNINIKNQSKEALLQELESLKLESTIVEYTPTVGIEVWHDEDAENPTECGLYEIYSFSTRHSNYEHPDDIEDVDALVESGRAFLLSYYEHGNCVWSLQGQGPQCRFDSVNVAGIIILKDDYLEDLEGEELYKVVSSLLEEYTAYCNGNTYGYSISSDDLDMYEESCGGYIIHNEQSRKDMAESIAWNLPADVATVLNLTHSDYISDIVDVDDIKAAMEARKAKDKGEKHNV
jgi:hypothetical protein